MSNLWLGFAFFLLPALGTVSHELGHVVAGLWFDVDPILHFDRTSYSASGTSPSVLLWISIAGPLQTILFGTAGLVALRWSRQGRRADPMTRAEWLAFWFSLFWVREAILIPWTIARRFWSRAMMPDEAKIAIGLGLPPSTLIVVATLLGTVAIGTAVAALSAEDRRRLLLIGLPLSALGLVFWFGWAGPRLLP